MNGAAWAGLIAAGALVAMAAAVPAGEGAPALAVNSPRKAQLVLIPGGAVRIGDDKSQADERPSFAFTTQPLLFDRTPVTVAQFAAFVTDTGYRTEAELIGTAGVFDHEADQWTLVKGANWRHPQGPDKPAAVAEHPVTQVSWADADIFCRSYGARLPTEFEWERAARLGQTPDGHVFTAADPPAMADPRVLNVWQGVFPIYDEGADGYKLTSPVGAYGAAPSGLTDMAGNVWQWTASWYGAYAGSGPIKRHVPAQRVQRGGSFLCDGHVCQGFRVTARSGVSPDTALMHAGFRCVIEPGRAKTSAGQIALR